MTVSWLVDSIVEPIPTGHGIACAVSIDGERRTSYSDLEAMVSHEVRVLHSLGLREGDRVGILLHNSTEYFALYFAAARLGAIAVRLNWRLTSSELEFIIKDAGCRVLCFDTSLAVAIAPIRDHIGVDYFLAFNDGQASVPSWAVHLPKEALKDYPKPPPASVELDDTVMLMYTSGTTGRPKGAMWTHGNTLWHAAMQVMKFSFTPSTVALTTGPFYHAGAFEVFLLPALMSRGRAVAMSSGGFSIDRLLNVIAREGVTDALLYPFMLYELLRHPRCSPEALGTLRRIKCGGDPIMPWAIDALEERLPLVELVPTYGLTEGGGNCTYLDFKDLRSHRTSVGRPLPLTEVRVVNDDGSAAGVGEVGEIIVRSPSVAKGYWNNPAETAITFVDGWCHTGDLGSYDAEGFLTINGRKKDMIRSGGENIYPAEVEAILTSHESVREAALIGVPDERYVEVGCAVMVLQPDSAVSDADLSAHCRQRLAGYKCPRYWVRVDELPRNGSGKILKYVLRDRYRSLGVQPSTDGETDSAAPVTP